MGKLSGLQVETIKAIQNAALQEIAAANATHRTGEQEEAIIKALKQLQHSGIAGTTAMKTDVAKKATQKGKQAIEEVSEDSGWHSQARGAHYKRQANNVVGE